MERSDKMIDENDMQYEENVITDVKKYENGYDIELDDSAWHFLVDDVGIEPHIGDVARFYGEGFGRSVRGLLINNQTIFYRSVKEEKKHQENILKKMKFERKERFENDKVKLDNEYASLPSEFQRRIDRFRKGNPEFRIDYEAYEMSVCVDAVKIANTLKTKEKIEEFSNMKYENQRQLVDFSDGHSGNSFSFALLLAKLYVSKPELVEKYHGALTPLVGCKEYGCTHGT